MKRTLLLTLPALLLAGCAAASKSTQTDALAIENRYPLDYAQQFTVDECAGGYSLITIDGSRYLVVPEGATVPAELDGDIVVLQQPIENIYLVSSSAMDPIISIGGLGAVALSGTQAENWYLDAARTAMEQGQIVYAGKYSAPDYETILAADCGLAIENTMIYHTPEVKEQLEKFGVPVLVERSSYESGPLARMEWVKLYGILLGKTNEAERVFADAEQRIAPLADKAPTGETVAFFSITSNNLATVRKGGDYVAEMIKMAGGSYAFADLTDSGNNLATVNISLEDFYAGAKDADVLIYNSTIEGELRSIDELIAKCPMLADFKAVQSGNVWCTAQSLFQQSMELPDLILDMNKVFTNEGTDDSALTFLTRVR
ncbi:ABC transporter substrate-binding protein [uncultured Gemmiger sp.]|uniref:ABC transporter substrate-binding protein n=1 Tax=uncultured Gemmiger sp. TaxID=1623490 RepID=UPI0025CF3B2B|nr:ABC transporter substrate-binding protein [uncultured Gemmiger sp.]